MKRPVLITTCLLLALTLCIVLMFCAQLFPSSPESPPGTTAPTETAYPSTFPTITEPASSSAPTIPAPTPPKDPDAEYIGSLYTRQELEAMENNSKGYGPGSTSGGARPPYAQSDQKKYGKYGANFIAPDNGCIYLTFDCGYEYQNQTADILDTLQEKNVKAVFFITLSYAQNNPGLVQRMINEGHTVGNHSCTHPKMPSLSIDEMVQEVMGLHAYMLENFHYEMHLFRPPEGAFSTRSLAVVQSLGYKTVHWSFAYADWDTDNQPDVSKALEKVTSSHHSGAIYLLHAVSETNAAILGSAIDFFRTQGYQLALFA